MFNPKGGGGGGPKWPTGQENVCHFSHGHAMVTKILDFIHKDLNYKVLKSFFDHPDRFFRNLAEIDEKLYMLSVINSTEIDALWNSSALKFIEMVEIALFEPYLLVWNLKNHSILSKQK